MKVLCLILVLAALASIECRHRHFALSSSASSPYIIYDLKNAQVLFAQFQHDFGKHYSSPQEARHRFEIFKTNLKEINKVNTEHRSWYAGITQFADMTHEEVKKCCMGLNPEKNINRDIILPRIRRILADSSSENSSSE